MGVQTSSSEALRIVLVRPGIDAREFLLPSGSTVGDLLAQAEVGADDSRVMIGGKDADAGQLLEPDSIVSLVPRERRRVPSDGAWHEMIGSFRGDPIIREIAEAGRAIRQAERDDR